MSLNHVRHEKFFNRCLIALPAQAASEDSNKLAIIYFCLHGLKLLNKFNFLKEELRHYENYIWDNFYIVNDEYATFRATLYFQHAGDRYDYGNLTACLFAVYILMILESDFKKMDWKKLLNYVIRCQNKNKNENENNSANSTNTSSRNSNIGGFSQSVNEIGFGEMDLRQCYIALILRKLILDRKGVDITTDIDINLLKCFILNRLDYNGGFCHQNLDEPHLGFTFCAVASLKLLDYPVNELEKTRNWLLHRQTLFPLNGKLGLGASKAGFEYDDDDVNDYKKDDAKELEKELEEELEEEDKYFHNIDVGGFNGRNNKRSDTCYSWWCTGSLFLINRSNLTLFDRDAAEKYLLENTQNSMLGGFSSVPESTPDPMHTYLALASLSLWDHERFGLTEIEPLLVISKEVYEHYLVSSTEDL